MGIVSMREVHEHGTFIKVTIALSLITALVAVSLYFMFPRLKIHAEERRLRRDIESIERVYNAMQSVISEGGINNMPSALWDISLSDFESLSSLSEFNKAVCDRLNVSSLKKLEGDGFESKAFKGSRYVSYMYDGSREIHLTVKSNDPVEHEDVVY